MVITLSMKLNMSYILKKVSCYYKRVVNQTRTKRKEFIDKDRSKLVKPIIFIIVASLIYTLISHFFHIEQGYVNYDSPENSTTT